MEDEHKSPVRIVVKKKKGHGGHHGGAWKVAYADFVTAMMALFIVLWIVGQNSTVKNAIAAYFKDPGVFESSRSGGVLDGAPAVKPDASAKPVVSEIDKLKIEGKKIEEAISSTPAFDVFKDKVQVTVTKEGLRVELVENSSGLFFDVGSAKIKSETVALLGMIASEIGRLPNKVIVEGYTDARPYVDAAYTNWELSADRANTARRILEQKGLRKDQVLEVRGFGDRNLKHPEKPMDFANRRVSILVTLPKEVAVDSISGGKVSVKPNITEGEKKK